MSDRDDEVYHRHLDTEGEEPAIQIAEHVADICGVEATELESTWSCFDHVIDMIFKDPPAPEANVEVRFTYEDYRIVVDQEGDATFIRVDE